MLISKSSPRLTPFLDQFKSKLSPMLMSLMLAGASPSQLAAQDSTGDWPHYRGDITGKGFSTLTTITPANVKNLEIKWRFSLRNVDAPNDRNPNSQVTPLLLGEMMYLPTVDSIVALDSLTGNEIWRFPIDEGRPSRRGVAYWPGNANYSSRIIFTVGNRLIALNSETGLLDQSFGDRGEVDIGIPYISVPLVYKDIIVVGANTPPGTQGGIGNPRAFSAISGEKLWEFSSVPRPGESGHGTWANDSWENRLGANSWPFYFTVDAETDLLYLPLASPLPFAYGGDRAGDNLFANSIVAVDIHSGKYVWHFQTIHHDLWDHDPPAPPTLFDIDRDGTTVPALAVTTKSGYLFLLNRETGDAIFGIREQAVASSSILGEVASPTQPTPIITPPMARVSFGLDELVTADRTSSDHAQACADLIANTGEIYNAGPYTPWTLKDSSGAGAATLLFPGLAGGPNWGGVAFDPNSKLAFVFASDLGTIGWLEETGEEFPYRLSTPQPSAFAVNIGGQVLPCQQPPWSHLTAIDTTSGEIAWRLPIGISESLPAENQNTGRPGRASALITASDLLFIAATDDNRLRALRASTGEMLWEDSLEQRGNANPMTFLDSAENQRIAISATDELIVYGLRD
jgi:quinoprotein glucose dehydrogenase